MKAGGLWLFSQRDREGATSGPTLHKSNELHHRACALIEAM